MKEGMDMILREIPGMVSRCSYFPRWYLRNMLSRQKRPLQTVLFITDYCNLSCRHCTPEGHKGSKMKSYDQIGEELRIAYRMGSRFIDFEGGEPTLWRDGDKTLNDLYDLVKEIGFFSCTLTTNGQRSFGDTHADSVWVSVDGYGDFHDKVRGIGTFRKLDQHIRTAGHPHLSIAMAVNRLNMHSVKRLALYARKNPAIEQVAFNFHTPFPGTEELTMTQKEKEVVIRTIIRLKRAGYPVMNSVSGLKKMFRPDFKKYCWIANYIMIDGTFLPTCPGRNLGVCDQCGFAMSGEMYCVMRLKPDTILSGLRLRLNV